MSDRDSGKDGRSDHAARGFSTRAIRAASRAPKLDQTPTTVPIYQTATFASADADELGEVLADPHNAVGLEDLEDLQSDFAAALAAIPDEALSARESVPALGAI